MSAPQPQPDGDFSRHQIAAEVLELGAALFDTMIEDAAARQPAPGSANEAYPADEVRAAADDFFAALRVLLGLESATGTSSPAAEDDHHPQN